jgi:uncharacterized membrane protein HdeD (DUF308 family)
MESKSLTNFRMLGFNGVIAVVYGLLAIFAPENMLKSIIWYFGILIFIIGIAMLIGVYNNFKNKTAYGMDLFWSVITIIIGLLLIFRTTNVIYIFAVLIGSWAILMGIAQLYLMTKVIGSSSGKNTLLINGLISVVFGIIVIFKPIKAGSIIVIISGILALIIGIIMISLSVSLKKAIKNKG